MKNYFFFFMQILVYLIGRTLMLSHKVIVVNIPDLDRDKRYIIVSNHPSKIDPFFVTCFFPFKLIIKNLFPIRPITFEEYFEKFHWRYLLHWSGCFSTSKERNGGKKPLELAQKFLNRGETILIFPEGEVNKKNKLDKSASFGVGPIYLEKNNKDVLLIPAKISYLAKGKVRVEYKEPFRHNQFPKNLQPLIKDVMKHIYE